MGTRRHGSGRSRVGVEAAELERYLEFVRVFRVLHANVGRTCFSSDRARAVNQSRLQRDPGKAAGDNLHVPSLGAGDHA